MWHVIAATSGSASTSAPIFVPGPFLLFFLLRALWRQTRVTLPDGRRVTRGQELTMRRQYAVWLKQYQKYQRDYARWYEQQQRRGYR